MFFLGGKVFNQVVEKSGELFNSIFRNTNCLGRKELSIDCTELSTSSELDHLDEGLANVIGELNEAVSTFRQFLEEREDTVNCINSGGELVVNNIEEVSVLSFSLDVKI